MLLGVLIPYVGMNVTFVLFVPVVHPVRLTVEVVREPGQEPISGASVGWAHVAQWGCADWAEGVTGASGGLQMSATVNDQRWWCWPRIGTFRFGTRALRVEAEGFHPREVAFSEAFPDMRYRNPTGQVRISLRPK